ncbi:MAG: tetratricopeptide repeat protein [Pseudonocardiales bacterium]|nr:tetratricopeptide repeat protein [Pseudonocardiales bacterium]
MTSWPSWRVGDAESLAAYVQTGVAPALLPDDLNRRLRGPGAGSRLERARALFEVLAERGIHYVHEPSISPVGKQQIRPPDQVLARPGEGTCVDLAVIYAGMCLDAGLHPIIALLDPTRPGEAGHAVVILWLAGDWRSGPARGYPGADGDWATPPRALTDDLRHAEDDPGAYLAVDITACTGGGDWPSAIRDGAAMITGGDERWQWSTAADIGLRYDDLTAHPLPWWPTRDVLVSPYLDPDPTAGPLTQVQARRGVVPFLGREELEVLRDWCEAPDVLPRPRIGIIHGVGGAGKTHLTAKVADWFRQHGWYTGFLKREPDQAELRWLARIVSPVLIVVDYVETAEQAEVRNLMAELRHRSQPSCVLLTARAINDWWTTDLAAALNRENIQFTLLELDLPDRHPYSTAVFRRAMRAFNPDLDPDLTDPPEGRWTTLDLIMQAWLGAHGITKLPKTQGDLYQVVLEHEFRYWRDTATSRDMLPLTAHVLRAAGASVSLLAPNAVRLGAVLSAVDTLEDNPALRDNLVELMNDLLPADPGDGTVTLRPDPVADHLLLAELIKPQDPKDGPRALLHHLLDRATPGERSNATIALTRAAEVNRSQADDLAADSLRHCPDLWSPALAVAGAVGGPFVTALTKLANTEDSRLPWDEISAHIPTGHGSLRALALTAAQRMLPTSPPETDQALAERAAALHTLAVRQSESGDWAGALKTITEAVTIRRALTGTDPAFLPDLADSLNNLAGRQSENGDREGGLETITEAVGHYRALAEADADAFEPDLAAALTNLAIHQSENGDREGGLETITEAVGHYRALADANPVFLPDLAASLNNLAVHQSENGDREAGLETITEAVGHYRALARTESAMFLPNLADSLNNLAVHQSENGDREGGLETITEAVGHYRALVDTDSAAFLPDLARSLNNLAVHQSENGNRAGALDTITKAARYYRTLADANPAFLPDLAASLTNRAVYQGRSGDLSGALETITESAGYYRALADANPAFLPNFAASLTNLAGWQSENGDHPGALKTIVEAVSHYRTLTRTEPAAFLPDLARSLNNLAVHQSQSGNRAGALESITEAAGHYRGLADISPAFLPNLAASLNNLAIRQSENGDQSGALETMTEAVAARRALVRTNSAAFLPDLADSLTNLAVYQSKFGDLPGALESVTEAVGYYRALTDTNPTFLPNFAASLNNLAIRQSENGDQSRALETITEAVTIQRALARTNSAAFLPDLTDFLTTLASRQRENGDRAGALESITEAVGYYSALTDTNPAFLPDFATSLNNLAVHQSDNGDLRGALETITKVVGYHRALADANPALLPKLATSLDNFAVYQSRSGNHAEALETITEAITIRGNLTRANPAAFLPDLADTLANLAEQVLSDAHWEVASRSYEQSLDGLRDGAAAELMLQRAAWHLGHHRTDDARRDLVRAAGLAQIESDATWASRSRRAVREFAASEPIVDANLLTGVDLPGWATDALPEDVVAVLDAWLAAESWPHREAAIRGHQDRLTDVGEHLDLAMFLFPQLDGLAELNALLNELAAHGSTVLDQHRAAYEHHTSIAQWMSTRTWRESLAFVRQHPELLSDPRTLELLRANAEEPAFAQYAGIVALCRSLPLGQVFDAITDPGSAADMAVTMLEQGDVEAIADLAAAAPDLELLPFTGGYVAAIWSALTGSTDTDAIAALAQAAEQASPIQRRAGVIRLRRLAATYPQHASTLRAMAELLGAETRDG